MTAPAGWKPDPENDDQWRYWNGEQWTEDRAPRLSTSSPQPPPPEDADGGDASAAKLGCGGAAILVILVAIVLSALGVFGDGDSGGSADDPKYGAFNVCTQFVKERLKAPSTASFRNYFEDDAKSLSQAWVAVPTPLSRRSIQRTRLVQVSARTSSARSIELRAAGGGS